MAATAEWDVTDGPVLSFISNRIRALRKKQNRITKIEKNVAQGKSINKEQEGILRSKPSVTATIDELENLRQPLSAAVAEEISLAICRHQFSDQSTVVAADGKNLDDGKGEVIEWSEGETLEVDREHGIVEDLLNLLYFACMFDVKSRSDYTSTMLTRTHERRCCLANDYVADNDDADLLGESDLDLIAMVGGLVISRPVDSGVSHKNALQRCIEHAKLWLAKSDQPIESESSVTYAGLREKLTKIMGSDYFTTTPEMKASVVVPVHHVEGSAVEKMDDNSFVLRISHGGLFDEGTPINYVGGWVEDIRVDPDKMSILEIDGIAHDLGYNANLCKYYYFIPNYGFEDGLRLVSCDNEVIDMFANLGEGKVVSMFFQLITAEVSVSESDNLSEGGFSEGDSSEKNDEFDYFIDGGLNDSDDSDQRSSFNNNESGNIEEKDWVQEDSAEDDGIWKSPKEISDDEDDPMVNVASLVNVEKLKDDPMVNVASMKKSIRSDHMLNVSDSVAYRAKKKALKMIEANHKEQYLRMWDYCATLRKTNPGSVAVLKVDRLDESIPRRFLRCFIMYDAQRRGFLDGCRPIIGLDGCHLKGPFGGQLLSAVALDANNQSFPLAMAVVEADTKISWEWFLENLIDVIGRPEEKGWTFISGRQKGLVECFTNLMPRAEHRYCMRHLYANFKDQFKGQELRDLVWRAASAFIVDEWDFHMKKIKELDSRAFDWLSKISPTLWTKSHFSGRSKSDMLSNSISESFNHYIQESRDKPVVTMLEMIRKQLMKTFQSNKVKIAECHGNLCPNISKLLEELKMEARDYEVIFAGNGIFEVSNVTMTHVVDISKKVCTCRRWDITGIPCVHGVASIIIDNGDVGHYVNDCYKKDAWSKAYEHMIYPIPDISMWERTPFDPLLPPPLRRLPGRPYKSRIKAKDEPTNPYRVRKFHTSLRCTKCGAYGHNVSTCKGSVKDKKTKVSVGGRGKRGGIVVGGSGRGAAIDGRGAAANRGGRGVAANRGGRGVAANRSGRGAANRGGRGGDMRFQSGGGRATPSAMGSTSGLATPSAMGKGGSQLRFGDVIYSSQAMGKGGSQLRFGDVIYSSQASTNAPK